MNEAGGTLAGGHSIADDSVKYGLSVTGWSIRTISFPMTAASLAIN